jgi:DNA-binding NtrC family response regulator
MMKNWMESRYTLGSLIARSDAMRAILPEAERAANGAERLMIVGDTGVGKKLLARAIHYSGIRSSKPFVTLHCERLIPENVDRILLGEPYEQTKGKLEEAAESTLLLAGIENLCPVAQERLLHLLKEETFTTGSGETRMNDARILATACSDALTEQLSQGSFPQELYEMLSESSLIMPSMAERADDIPFIVADVLREFSARERIETPAVPFHYMELLTKVEWPQNAQQLRNHLESVMALCEGTFEPAILLAHFEEIETPQTIRAAVHSLLTRLSGQNESQLASVLGK